MSEYPPLDSELEDKFLLDFFNNLASQQEPLGSEFEQVLQDNYWDIIRESNKDK
jgi:hypothetical protein